MQLGRTNGDGNYARGFAMATVGIVVVSPDALLVRLIETDVWTLLFWRGLLSALALGVFLAARHRSATPEILRTIGRLDVVAALLLAATAVLFVIAIRLTTVANALVIVATMPLFAAALGRVFLREAVPRQTWIAVATVFAGITVIFAGSLGGGNPVGDLSAVGAAFSFAGALVIFRRTRAVDMAPTVALSGLILAVVVAPLATPLAIDARSLAYLLVLGALVRPISFMLLVTAPRYLPAPDVALVMLLESVLGPLWVWLVLAEVPARETFLGGAVILGTLILLAIHGVRHNR